MAIQAVKKLIELATLTFDANSTDDNAVIAAVNELIADHATFKTVTDDIKVLVNDIRTKLNAFVANGMLSSAGLAIGSTVQNVANLIFIYSVGGVVYTKVANAVGTAPGNDVIPQGKFGAVAFDIGADGTIDVIEAAGNAAGYDSAVLALAGLAAAGADHVRIGTVTATKSDGAFTFGTTGLAAANTAVIYTSSAGVLAALGAAVASSTPVALTATTITSAMH
jgi:hypothetical protein